MRERPEQAVVLEEALQLVEDLREEAEAEDISRDISLTIEPPDSTVGEQTADREPMQPQFSSRLMYPDYRHPL